MTDLFRGENATSKVRLAYSEVKTQQAGYG